MAQVHIWKKDKRFSSNFMGEFLHFRELYCGVSCLEEYETLFRVPSFNEGKYCGRKRQVPGRDDLSKFDAFEESGF